MMMSYKFSVTRISHTVLFFFFPNIIYSHDFQIIWIVATKLSLYYMLNLLQMKKQQQKIEMILDSKKIDYEKIDISSSEKLKNEMREIMGDPKGLPPRLAKGDQYLGVS